MGSQRLGSSQGLEQPGFPDREPQMPAGSGSCGAAALLFAVVCSQMLCGLVIAGFFCCAPANTDHLALPVVEPSLLQPKSQAACYGWPKAVVPAPSHALCSPHLAFSRTCTSTQQDLNCASQGSTVWLYEPTTRVCVAI